MAELTILQIRLEEAETAYHRLQIGALEASVGSGDMQVSFTRAEAAKLRDYIADLKRQIARAQGGNTAGCRRMEFEF